MTVPPTTLIVVLAFAAFALGFACLALWFAWGARRDARQALASSHQHVPTKLPREQRREDADPPEGQSERRRHRAPDDTPRARRGDADDLAAAMRGEPETATLRRQPPPLPRPGAIGRDQ